MKPLKIPKKPNPHTRKIVLTFKVNAEEMQDYLAKAHAWTGGNISELIRYAVYAFLPSSRPSKEKQK